MLKAYVLEINTKTKPNPIDVAEPEENPEIFPFSLYILNWWVINTITKIFTTLKMFTI